LSDDAAESMALANADSYSSAENGFGANRDTAAAVSIDEESSEDVGVEREAAEVAEGVAAEVFEREAENKPKLFVSPFFLFLSPICNSKEKNVQKSTKHHNLL